MLSCPLLRGDPSADGGGVYKQSKFQGYTVIEIKNVHENNTNPRL